jgi:stage V sporulation protein SpoVS
MSFLDQISGLVSEFEGGAATPGQAAQVAQQADPSAVAGALSSVFNSTEAGSFGQNVSQLFSQSNPDQRAGILNQLIASAAPEVLQSIGGGAFSGLLGQAGGGAAPQVTPEQAAQIPHAAIEELANHAQQNNPGIVEEASQFYAQHPALINSLGAGAAALVMRHFSQHA